jgi:HrpA-like RNA helicase
MTDGLLLQEARSDLALSHYGLIMVDEAHERSLNIDFTIGLLRKILDERPDFRVVVSSATIQPEAFSRFFGAAPHVSIDARAFEVDVHYRPMETETFGERIQALATTIARMHRSNGPGDILVFLTGEAEIKNTIQELLEARLKNAVLLPLYGRLTREEQEMVFDSFGKQRKIILATNIAETSITIAGVRFVVDLGLAKVPFYDQETGISTLSEMPISQASARQRMGRAGRTAPGVCIRLYSEPSYKERPEYQLEEIRRTDLADVVLRLIDLGIQEVESFPFITPPPRAALRAAIDALQRLGAIDEDRELTDVGRRMVPFPLSPRLARVIVAAADEFPTVFQEVLTVSALLSVRSPQVLPMGEEEQARDAHYRFSDSRGDLVAGIKIVRSFENARHKKAFCERNYLDFTLMKEILRVRDQLKEIAAHHGIEGTGNGNLEEVIKCVMVAYSHNICRRVKGGWQYETPTGIRVRIHPGSCLIQQRPQFIVASEIVKTFKTWARSVSAIDASWLPEYAPDLARHWRIRPRKNQRRTRAARIEYPTTVAFNGEYLRVKVRRRQPSVDIRWEQIKELDAAPTIEWPGELPELTARLVHGRDKYLSGWPLSRILGVAKHLRLDEGELKRWPEGELFVAERESWKIMQHLNELLRVVRGFRHRKAAFLTLIPNGAGGYWYDAVRDFEAAVEQSLNALLALSEESVISDEDKEQISVVVEKLCKVQETLR